MKILFVCQQYIHAVRWINQLKDTNHQVFIFDCLDKEIHTELRWATYYENWSKRKLPYIKGEYFLEKKHPFFFEKIASFFKVTASQKLVEIIQEIQPDLVHSLEMQTQSYPVFKAKNKIDFKWAYSSWGSDIYLYQNKKNHYKKMKYFFSKLDYLFVDASRDIELAKNLGYKNKVSGVFPGGGGYHIENLQQFVKPVFGRNLILIKGYHHWTGRALKVLRAIEMLVDTIRDYDIYVYSAHNSVVEKIKEINHKHQLNIQFSSRYNQISHQELLKKFGQAKIAIGNNISDGIPNTLLEAIILGAFPIQSNPGGATEDYIEDGKNGFLIENPEDSKEIANHILKGINDDILLERAFGINQNKAKTIAYQKIRKKILDAYKDIG